MKIKTFNQACKLLKYNPEKVLPNVASFPKAHQKSLTAYAKLVIIAEALNYDEATKKKWVPNWNDYNEYKWYPWFYLDKPGFRFGASGYLCTSTGAGGARLCYRSSGLSDYAAKQFKTLYKDLIVL